jgi:hypothetical protein
MSRIPGGLHSRLAQASLTIDDAAISTVRARPRGEKAAPPLHSATSRLLSILGRLGAV